MDSEAFEKLVANIKGQMTCADVLQQHGIEWKKKNISCPLGRHKDKNPSFSIFDDARAFRCHSCGQGGDVIELETALNGGDRGQAIRTLTECIGNGSQPDSKPATKKRKGSKVHETADSAASAVVWSLKKNTGREWIETRRDIYNDDAGDRVAAVLRLDRADGAKDDQGKPLKEYRPIRVVQEGWQIGDPEGLWPLFNLPEILQTDDSVYISEGEPAACAGADIGLTSTTSAHGAQSAAKSDWAAMSGRDTVILPDNDSGGKKYTEKVAELVQAAGARSIKILSLPDLPPKGDLVQFIEARSDKTPEEIRNGIKRLAEAAETWSPPPQEETPDESSPATNELCTDLSNAERFATQHKGSVLFDVRVGKWRVWDGSRWANDSTGKVMRLAHKTARSILVEASKAADKTDMSDLTKWALRSQSRERLQAMIDIARYLEPLVIEPKQWDRDGWLFNCLNGTINLKTGELYKHKRDQCITRRSPIAYDPDAVSEIWDRCLNDALDDADAIAFLQRASGYSLTADYSEEKLFLVLGPEATGKSTVMEALRAAMGDYAVTSDFDAFIKRQGDPGIRNDIARLAGSRMVCASESEDGKHLAEAVVKRLTGGDTITARFMRQEFFEFEPTFKIWLAANHAPRVRDDDSAMWRRIMRVPFERTIPKGKRDPDMKKHLKDPKSGGPAVLAWMVKGCLAWQEEGLGSADLVDAATTAYRDGMNPLGAFFEDRCVFHTDAYVMANELREAYEAYARESGVKEKYFLSPNGFAERLRAKGCEPARTHKGRIWGGIELERDTVTPRDPTSGMNAKKIPHEEIIPESTSRGVTVSRSDDEQTEWRL